MTRRMPSSRRMTSSKRRLLWLVHTAPLYISSRSVAIFILTKIYHRVWIWQLYIGCVEVLFNQAVITPLHSPLHTGCRFNQDSNSDTLIINGSNPGDSNFFKNFGSQHLILHQLIKCMV